MKKLVLFTLVLFTICSCVQREDDQITNNFENHVKSPNKTKVSEDTISVQYDGQDPKDIIPPRR